MTEAPVLRVKSHRAMHKLKRITPDVQWYWNPWEGNSFCQIPAEHVAEALAITGITRARPKRRLMKCWG